VRFVSFFIIIQCNPVFCAMRQFEFLVALKIIVLRNNKQCENYKNISSWTDHLPIPKYKVCAEQKNIKIYNYDLLRQTHCLLMKIYIAVLLHSNLFPIGNYSSTKKPGNERWSIIHKKRETTKNGKKSMSISKIILYKYFYLNWNTKCLKTPTI
jgi:hypothetical protein